MLSLLCLSGVGFSYNYFYSRPSYFVRDSLISLGNHVNNNVVVDGIPFSYTLYNDEIPGLMPYDYSLTPKEVHQRKKDTYENYPNAFEIIRTHQNHEKFKLIEGEIFEYESNQYRLIANYPNRFYKIQLIKLEGDYK